MRDAHVRPGGGRGSQGFMGHGWAGGQIVPPPAVTAVPPPPDEFCRAFSGFCSLNISIYFPSSTPFLLGSLSKPCAARWDIMTQV